MDIEDLSKQQLLLLTVLVNFVVSIATGVLTVSMLDQTPTTVTQTVNKIVDHTVETLAAPLPPVTVTTEPAKAAPTPEQLLTSAIASDHAHTVLLYAGSTSTPAIAFGTYLPKQHAVAVATQPSMLKDVTVQFAQGETLPASISHSGATVTIYGFADSATLPAAPAASLDAAASLAQGQTVVALTKESAAVTGIISKVDETGIQTSLPPLPPGAVILDLSGNIVGIASNQDGVALPAGKITTLLSAPVGTPAKSP